MEGWSLGLKTLDSWAYWPTVQDSAGKVPAALAKSATTELPSTHSPKFKIDA